MAPWHVEYFRLKEFERWHVQEGPYDLPLKQVIKPSRKTCSPYWEQRSVLISEDGGTQRGIHEQALVHYRV